MNVSITGKTILITGGAGFIGSWLCENLLSEDNKIICIDNLISGNKDNIKHLLSNKNFNFIEKDITEKIAIKEKIDSLFHLASPASPKDFKKIPIEIMLTNSIGTNNMLNLAMKNNAKFLITSTSEVYGDPKIHPQNEDYWGNVNPIGERSCYDESKRFSESLTINFNKKHGVDVKIARIFNTYGPRMRNDDGRLIPNIIIQCLNNEPLTVYGDGTQTRSFCFVDDMIIGLKTLIISDQKGPFNIGNTNEISIIDMVKKIKELTKSSSEIVFKPLPKDDPKVRRPDITKINKALGWQPTTLIDDGLKKTIEYFKKEQ